MKKILNLEYSCIHGSYWMYYGVAYSFSSAFLLSRGYNNSQIGIILAIGNILAVLLQPIMADIADKSKKISVFEVGKLSSAFLMVLSSLLFVIKGSCSALSILFVMIVGWLVALQPILNALAFKLSETKHKINFGACRSVGSLAYSIITWFLGSLVEKKGAEILPITGEFVLLMLLTSLILTKFHFNKASQNDYAKITKESAENIETADIPNERINLLDFARRNKMFLILNLGVVGVYFSNSILNNYMLQIVENVGGSSTDMGRILSVMAFLELPTLFFFENIRRRFSCQQLLKFSAIAFVIKIALIFLADGVPLIYIAHVFQLVSFALFLPAMVGFTAEKMSPGEAVKGQALYTAMITVSSVFASVIGGILLDSSGAKLMLLAATVITAIGAMIVICVTDKI